MTVVANRSAEYGQSACKPGLRFTPYTRRPTQNKHASSHASSSWWNAHVYAGPRYAYYPQVCIYSPLLDACSFHAGIFSFSIGYWAYTLGTGHGWNCYAELRGWRALHSSRKWLDCCSIVTPTTAIWRPRSIICCSSRAGECVCRPARNGVN